MGEILGGTVAPGAPRPTGAMAGPRISVVVVDGDATGEGGSTDGSVGRPIHVVGHVAFADVVAGIQRAADTGDSAVASDDGFSTNRRTIPEVRCPGPGRSRRP